MSYFVLSILLIKIILQLLCKETKIKGPFEIQHDPIRPSRGTVIGSPQSMTVVQVVTVQLVWTRQKQLAKIQRRIKKKDSQPQTVLWRETKRHC